MASTTRQSPPCSVAQTARLRQPSHVNCRTRTESPSAIPSTTAFVHPALVLVGKLSFADDEGRVVVRQPVALDDRLDRRAVEVEIGDGISEAPRSDDDDGQEERSHQNHGAMLEW